MWLRSRAETPPDVDDIFRACSTAQLFWRRLRDFISTFITSHRLSPSTASHPKLGRKRRTLGRYPPGLELRDCHREGRIEEGARSVWPAFVPGVVIGTASTLGAAIPTVPVVCGATCPGAVNVARVVQAHVRSSHLLRARLRHARGRANIATELATEICGGRRKGSAQRKWPGD